MSSFPKVVIKVEIKDENDQVVRTRFSYCDLINRHPDLYIMATKEVWNQERLPVNDWEKRLLNHRILGHSINIVELQEL